MRYLRTALRRLAGFFTGHRQDADLREELQAHLDLETAENVRRGMDPEAARRQALLVSGGLTQAAEAVRDQRGLPWLESIAADLKYAWRALRRARRSAVRSSTTPLRCPPRACSRPARRRNRSISRI